MSRNLWGVLLAGMLGAAAVRAADPVRVVGVLTAVSQDAVTVHTRSNQTVTVALQAATVVKINGKVSPAAELKPGMREMTLAPAHQPATAVWGYVPIPRSSFSVAGKILAVSPGRLTVLTKEGTTNSVAYNAHTRVLANNLMIKADELRPGMQIASLVLHGQPAVEIRVLVPGAGPQLPGTHPLPPVSPGPVPPPPGKP